MELDQAAGIIDDRLLVSTVTTNLLGPIRLTSALADQLKSRRRRSSPEELRRNNSWLRSERVRQYSRLLLSLGGIRLEIPRVEREIKYRHAGIGPCSFSALERRNL
jgi:hypothetical protein